MGAGASAVKNDSMNKSLLSEEEVKAACGSHYDPFFFDALKNEEEMVFITDFNRLVSSSTELEVCRLFLTYSPRNNMNEQTFLTLLRDAKLLNKGLFSIRDAQKLFFKLKNEYEPTSSRGITYKTWRHQALPEIASLKGMELERLLSKLSHCEDLIVAIALKRDDQKVVEVPPAEVKPAPVVSSPPPSVLGIKGLFSDAQRDACVKIQTAQRTKQAIIAAQRQKELRNLSTKKQDVIPVSAIEAGEPAEIALVQLFHSYCPNGELSKKTFTTLLKDAGVYDKELTLYDAEFTFDRAKAKCLAPASQFQDQVILNKRVSYQVFRLIILPEAATMKGQSIHKFIEVIVNAIPLDTEASLSAKNTTTTNGSNTATGVIGANSTSVAKKQKS